MWSGDATSRRGSQARREWGNDRMMREKKHWRGAIRTRKRRLPEMV